MRSESDHISSAHIFLAGVFVTAFSGGIFREGEAERCAAKRLRRSVALPMIRAPVRREHEGVSLATLARHVFPGGRFPGGRGSRRAGVTGGADL